jgi:eukaryotic-like serine/threonine-protein kinase
MTLPAGVRLGPYEIVEPIGAGGMGEVYRARDTRLGRDVAIKVLPAGFAHDADRLRRFEQEARAVAALSHPNIVALFDIGARDGAPFLVSELLEGRTLRELSASGAMPVRQAVDTAVQITRGLAAAHEKGIVHRDLKPANVFVTKAGHVKILDFGLAKLARMEADESGSAVTAAPRTETGAVMGTVGYMSPEQVRGQRVDHRTDIFALGCVLHEMLSGAPPFRRETAAETMTAILNDEPPGLTGTGQPVPAALERVVRRCLEKEVGQRFSSAHDLALAIEALGAPTETGAVAAAAAGSGPTRPAWRLALTVVAILVALAAGVGTSAWYFRRAELTASSSPPTFQRLTFRHGWVGAARFDPASTNTVVYSAAWERGPNEIFSVRTDGPESVSLGHSPAELLAVSPSSELALALDSHPQKSLATWAGTLARVPFSGGTPRKVVDRVSFADWSPDGKQLARVVETEAVDQLEYPEGHALYASGGAIAYPRVSPAGDTVAFFEAPDHFGSGAVAVVDRAGKRTTLTEVYPGAGGLAWSPSGDEVWFTAATTGGRQELRAVTLDKRQRLIARGPLAMRLLDVARDGRVLVACDQTRARAFFRGEKDTSERELSWLDGSMIQDLSRDARLAVLNEVGEGVGAEGPQLYIRETSGNAPTKLGPGYGGFSWDEQTVGAYSSDGSAVFIYPVAQGPSRTIRVPGVAISEVWGPLQADGGTLVISGSEAQRGKDGPHGMRIWLADLKGSKLRAISPEGVIMARPRPIPPDGRFVLGVLGSMSIGGTTMAYPVDGGKPRPFKGLLDGELVGGWSLDGQSCYAYGPGVPLRMYRVDGRTGTRTFVREIVPIDRAGRVKAFFALTTPDAKAYAYTTIVLQSNLYLIAGLK